MTPISDFDRVTTLRKDRAITQSRGSCVVNKKPSLLAVPVKEKSRAILLRGFTLLEMLLVMAIIGLASLVVFPNITGMETRTFNSRVREAHTLLNLARRTAVVSGQPSTASFSVTPEPADRESMLSPFSAGTWDGSGITLTFQDSANQEVDVEGTLHITFYPEGGSTGGSLILAFEDRLASIVINPFTGRVDTEFLDER